MKRIGFILSLLRLLTPMVISANATQLALGVEKKPYEPQKVTAYIYRLEKSDSRMVLDMNVDLTQVNILPDCTVYLYPWLRTPTDSLLLPPVMLNGPQSNRMYNRRKALGKIKEAENQTPHIVLRGGDNPLPRVNYQLTDIPYSEWMDQAEVVLRDENCNCDARLAPLAIEVLHVPPVVLQRVDTLVIRDTVRVIKTVERPIVAAKKKEVVTEHAGYIADIYFPVGGMKILPEHELNQEAWRTFVSETDSLRSGEGKTVMGITVTGFSSPEGSYSSNDVVAKRRAQALKKYLESVYNPELVEVRVEWMAEDWDRLIDMIRGSEMPEKNQLLDIINGTDDLNRREVQLKQVSGGKPWAYMVKEYFPKLRRVSCRIGYLKKTIVNE